jgi:hypothetical protein
VIGACFIKKKGKFWNMTFMIGNRVFYVGLLPFPAIAMKLEIWKLDHYFASSIDMPELCEELYGMERS